MARSCRISVTLRDRGLRRLGGNGGGVANGLSLQGVVCAGKPALPGQHGSDRFGGWSIAVGDRPEVAVDGSVGELTDPEAAQRGDDLPVEAIPIEGWLPTHITYPMRIATDLPDTIRLPAQPNNARRIMASVTSM